MLVSGTPDYPKLTSIGREDGAAAGHSPSHRIMKQAPEQDQNQVLMICEHLQGKGPAPWMDQKARSRAVAGSGGWVQGQAVVGVARQAGSGNAGEAAKNSGEISRQFETGAVVPLIGIKFGLI